MCESGLEADLSVLHYQTSDPKGVFVTGLGSYSLQKSLTDSASNI